MDEMILNIKDAATYMNCSVSTIRNLVRKREIPYFRMGIKIYFKKSKLDNWMDNYHE